MPHKGSGPLLATRPSANGGFRHFTTSSSASAAPSLTGGGCAGRPPLRCLAGDRRKNRASAVWAFRCASDPLAAAISSGGRGVGWCPVTAEEEISKRTLFFLFFFAPTDFPPVIPQQSSHQSIFKGTWLGNLCQGGCVTAAAAANVTCSPL